MTRLTVMCCVLLLQCLLCSTQARCAPNEDPGIELARLARTPDESLSKDDIAILKALLAQSGLLDSGRLSDTAISTLGTLIARCKSDPTFQVEALSDSGEVFRHIGLDVDPRGFARLRDTISLEHGDPQVYGSIRDSSRNSTEAELRSIRRARRYIGIFASDADPQNTKPFPEPMIPLAMKAPRRPSLPAVRDEIIRLYEKDQGARDFDYVKLSEDEKKHAIENLDRVTEDVLKDFTKIFDVYGIPDNEKVGRFGTLAAWTIAHHSMSSPDLVRRAVIDARKLFRDGDLPDGPFALLVDRAACLVDHSEQTYGTFPVGLPSSEFYCPIADTEKLNARRATVYLDPVPTS